MNQKNVYFTPLGARRLQEEKEDLFKKLKDVQSQKGEAAETGGNQWHDNFSFEDLCRQESMLNAQISQLNALFQKMIVVDAIPTQAHTLTIGHVAVLEIDGVTRRIRVGGYGDSLPDLDPPLISYLAPMIKSFIGMEIGAEEDVVLGGVKKHIELVDIELEEPC